MTPHKARKEVALNGVGKLGTGASARGGLGGGRCRGHAGGVVVGEGGTLPEGFTKGFAPPSGRRTRS